MTPDDLVTMREIEHLKYRYLRFLDLKDWDGFAGVFEPGATADYGERLRFTGVHEIVAFMRESLGPEVITVHQVHHPEITLHDGGDDSDGGDTASALWALADRVVVPGHRVLVEGTALYHDRYRRGGDGAWRITHTGYERIYESTVSLDDVPSFRLTANRFAAPG